MSVRQSVDDSWHRRICEVAEASARAAGEVLLTYFGDDSIRTAVKAGGELTSPADLESEALIKCIIHSSFADHHVVAEEGGSYGTPSQHNWIVDPLDGTHNFLRGWDDWAVSIAYAHGTVVEVGVVYVPTTNMMYSAIRGRGASKNGHRLEAAATTKLADSVALCSASAPPWQTEARHILDCLWGSAHDIRMTGCGSRALCRVAEGSADMFAEVDGGVWDYAAGSLIAHESGAAITDYYGLEMTARSATVLACATAELQSQLHACAGIGSDTRRAKV
ncbi:inositol monophosphatase family protein [Rhodococcus sp. H29-C3]|uniref:inositol monophosphatase family protein n=1 Tax=Rhodococcus sp. H29-C3 TaxID=3046307 RepID=UPI0024BB490A|nr:inositol monophosphatase family protein [Rhodococcus sp. H29-C3]MDJ0363329.1 inositol monophosphatase family protein [Rhodococcus sp. H29-C3]